MKNTNIIRILTIFLVISFGCDASVDEVQTENRNLTQSKEFFMKHVVSVKVYDAINIKIKTDGKIVDLDGETEFLLHSGMVCKTNPDRHSSLTYKMLGLSQGKVFFEYMSRFDHSSFGKSLITIDRGRIEVPFYK